MIKTLLFSAAALAIAASPAAATSYAATLLGANEVPARNTPATGIGTLVLSADNRFAQVDVSFTGLTAPLTVAHAHCCAAAGANAGVAIDFLPPSLSAGSFSRLYDLTLASTYTGGFITASGGTAALAQARFLTALDAGQVYFNLHTSTFPGGEIRGNLGAVPEPSSWAMLIAGFGLVGAAARRRRAVAA
ncbi:CHRD domain-containing protein [Sandarakinorhabdus sp. AAP62]|uniref:CHRD domain-containing protein n=1 Tax=Sandarakinorhabdus sp. AAP62 TaxID=1248916 RepID=UPI0002ECA093|nr:CHRD domain-containing protein [Sandarakinorhabdus sp. AAP62]